jgi:hypothetical protein
MITLESINKMRGVTADTSAKSNCQMLPTKQSQLKIHTFIDYGRRYPKKFKLEVLSRIENGESALKVTDDIKVPKQTVYRWLQLRSEGKL